MEQNSEYIRLAADLTIIVLLMDQAFVLYFGHRDALITVRGVKMQVLGTLMVVD